MYLQGTPWKREGRVSRLRQDSNPRVILESVIAYPLSGGLEHWHYANEGVSRMGLTHISQEREVELRPRLGVD